MIRIVLVLVLAFLPALDLLAEENIARIAVMANGEIELNGESISLPELDERLRAVSQSHGQVLYFRENGQSEPPAEAIQVIDLVVKHELPISLSTKPDFSDFVDENGKSRPR